MGYGEQERRYAQPFAEALVNDPAFRAWVLRQTEFSDVAEDALLLHEEMKSRRGVSQTWWRSHYSEACRCAGCSGKETDILGIFEAASGHRFALHIEVKHPKDKFKANGIQSRGYPLRAKCWIDRPPKSVLPHQKATTVLLYSRAKQLEYAPHLSFFRTHITFESIAETFPHATAAVP